MKASTDADVAKAYQRKNEGANTVTSPANQIPNGLTTRVSEGATSNTNENASANTKV